MTYCLQRLDDGGHRRTEAVGPDKKLAEALRKRGEMELNGGRYQDIVTSRLAAFASEHVRLIGGSVSPKTVKEHRATLAVRPAHCGDIPLEKVSPKVAEEFLAARLGNVSPATANKDLRTLKASFGRAVKRRYLRENPFRDVKQVREPEKEIRVLTGDEVSRLMGACPSGAWRAFIGLAVTTGMRVGELTALRWRDVDLEQRLVQVRNTEHHLTKSRRHRTLALMPEAYALLAGVPQRGETVFTTSVGTPWGDNVRSEFRRIVKRAGIVWCTLHDLRRTFVSQLAMAGVNAAVVQKLAGHCQISTTIKHYTGIMPEALRAAQASLPLREALSDVSFPSRELQPGVQAETARVLTGAHAVG
jgi:integrase